MSNGPLFYSQKQLSMLGKDVAYNKGQHIGRGHVKDFAVRGSGRLAEIAIVEHRTTETEEYVHIADIA